MLKQTEPIFVLRIRRRRKFDVVNLWVCWFILLENHQTNLYFYKLTTKRCAQNDSLCNILYERLHQPVVD